MVDPSESNSLLDKNWNFKLLKAIVAIQSSFIGEKDIRTAFSSMLTCLLDVTDSKYGFLGEVLVSEEGAPYMIAHALTDISWDEETKKIYDQSMAKGFEFRNLNTLFGVTLATAKPVVSNDPKNDPRGGGLPKGHPGMKNYMGIPIKFDGKMVGMLGVANRERGYSEEIMHALEPILVTAGSMIQSMRSISRNDTIERDLQSSHQFLEEILNNINDSLVITNHAGVIKRVNRSSEDMFGKRKQSLLERDISTILLNESYEGYFKKIEDFILSGDKKNLTNKLEIIGLDRHGNKLTLEVGISEVKIGNNKLFINTFQDISERKIYERELQLANYRLLELSETDELTTLPNRRYFDKNAKKYFNTSRNKGCDLGLAIIDIDDFKLYNDNYGHQKGDECLKVIGSEFKDYFKRDCEFSARVGGEEFAVVMSHMTKEECIESLNQFREIVKSKKIVHKLSSLSCITLSIGLVMKGEGTASVGDMYSEADKALYEAKAKGKNLVVCSKID